MAQVPHIDLGVLYQGDDLPALSIIIEDENLEDACCQLRNKSWQLIRTLEHEILNDVLILKAIPANETARLPKGRLFFDVKIKIDGTVMTVMTAEMEVIRTRSECAL